MRDLLTRWGQSVSYHEFQHVLGDLNAITVSDGYSPWLLQDLPEKFEEHLLWQYMQETKVAVPKGFCRHYLNMIFRKSD